MINHENMVSITAGSMKKVISPPFFFKKNYFSNPSLFMEKSEPPSPTNSIFGKVLKTQHSPFIDWEGGSNCVLYLRYYFSILVHLPNLDIAFYFLTKFFVFTT